MKCTDHFIVDFHHIVGVSNIGMTVDSSEGAENYGIFEIPEEAAKLIKDKPYPYRLKVEHDEPSLWGHYKPHTTPEKFAEIKKAFIEACKKGEVEWSDPNKQCHHCGRYFDPAYDFIEDETLLNFCNGGTEEYPEDRFPDYCPECIEKLYDFCNDAVAAFAKDDVIKEEGDEDE